MKRASILSRPQILEKSLSKSYMDGLESSLLHLVQKCS